MAGLTLIIFRPETIFLGPEQTLKMNKGVFLLENPKRIFDPRFAGFRGRKEREIRNWICILGNLSQTRAICMTGS